MKKHFFRIKRRNCRPFSHFFFFLYFSREHESANVKPFAFFHVVLVYVRTHPLNNKPFKLVADWFTFVYFLPIMLSCKRKFSFFFTSFSISSSSPSFFLRRNYINYFSINWTSKKRKPSIVSLPFKNK